MFLAIVACFPYSRYILDGKSKKIINIGARVGQTCLTPRACQIVLIFYFNHNAGQKDHSKLPKLLHVMTNHNTSGTQINYSVIISFAEELM